jgi:glycine/D-amino acid oxidase-like deaminating enzyme
MEKSISIWEGTAPKGVSFEPLTGNKEADVVIIGGGITGITTAMLLSEAGKKVILLEALQIGLGTTGNSTGNLYTVVDEHLNTIQKKWSDEVSRDIVESRTAALNLIESTIQRHTIDCDFYRTSINYFTEQKDKEIEKELQKEFETLTALGLDVSWNTNSNLPFTTTACLTITGV